MRLVIDPQACQGHARCLAEAPGLVDLCDEGHAVLLVTGDLNPEIAAAYPMLPGARDQLSGRAITTRSLVTVTQAQLQQLVEAEAIRELIHVYARCADDGDNERMVSLFTDDCTAAFRPGEVLSGKAELLAWLTRIQSTIVASSHFMSNIDIRFDGPGHAIGHHYLYSFGRFAGYPDVADKHRWCRYENSYRRAAEEWRIESLALYASMEYGGDRWGESRGRVWPPADFRRRPSSTAS